MAVCDNCRKRKAVPARRSVTGRELCDPCADQLLGAAAGMLAAQQSGSDPVAGALSTAGWFRRIRAARKRD
jgi:hypothetical protein